MTNNNCNCGDGNGVLPQHCDCEQKELCHRCKDTIEPMEEIWYIKNKASCGYCTTSKEIENY